MIMWNVNLKSLTIAKIIVKWRAAKKTEEKTICLSKNLILNVQIWEVSLVNERWNDSSFLSFSLQFRTLNFWGLCVQNGAIENKDFIKKLCLVMYQLFVVMLLCYCLKWKTKVKSDSMWLSSRSFNAIQLIFNLVSY